MPLRSSPLLAVILSCRTSAYGYSALIQLEVLRIIHEATLTCSEFRFRRTSAEYLMCEVQDKPYGQEMQ